jgi:anti-sigma factor RsiW
MTSHLTTEELKGFADRSLAPQALLRVDRHLARCPDCLSELQRAVAPPRLPAVLKEFEAPLHVTYEQLSSYLDRSLDAELRPTLEGHLSICASCKAELDDLEAFEAREIAQATIQTPDRPEKHYRSVLSAWVRDFFAAPQRPRFGLAAFSLILVGVLAITPVWTTSSSSGAQLGAPGQSNHAPLSIVNRFVAVHPGQFWFGMACICLGFIAIWFRTQKSRRK